MLVKDGVSFVGVSPELVMALVVADGVYASFGETLVVTSVTDGVHGKVSYHPFGYAGDVRLPVEADAAAVVAALRKSLGSPFDVVLEATHIHIEFDVRRVV